MGLTSEQAHWIVGAELCALALALLLYELQVWQARVLRYALGATLLVLTAEGVLFPAIEGALTPARFDSATAQHLLLAALCLVVGLVELRRARRAVTGGPGRAALPLGLLATGAIFALHAQHHSPAPRVLLTVQHRILGASLAVGGLTRGAAELPLPAARSFKTAWLVPLFLAGVELLLYTETRG
ncbi:MAG: hypothetical protein DMD44_14100 [Gemmatimonadetes bacterium]|nr:MAG: hypothetical protein DMD44_14100 [Gemmatimonadota bacterium]